MAIKIVVPISGGKDSQACLKLALEEYDKHEVMGLFCDTQFEHPLTYIHIQWMREFYGVNIERLCAGSVEEVVKKFKTFPTSKFRMCTSNLKIQPSKKFYKSFAEKQGGFQVWLGMRSDESNDRKIRYQDKISNDLFAPHDFGKAFPKYLEKMEVMFRLPILDWTTIEVLDYLEGEKNPLYSQGSKRVGCFPCLASSDTNKEHAFNFDEFGKLQFEKVKEWNKFTNNEIFTSKSGTMRNNENQSDIFKGCSWCSM